MVQHCAVRLKDVRETLAHGHCKLQVTLSVKGKNCKLFEDLRTRPMLDAFFSHRISHLQQIHQESLGLFFGTLASFTFMKHAPKNCADFRAWIHQTKSVLKWIVSLESLWTTSSTKACKGVIFTETSCDNFYNSCPWINSQTSIEIYENTYTIHVYKYIRYYDCIIIIIIIIIIIVTNNHSVACCWDGFHDAQKNWMFHWTSSNPVQILRPINLPCVLSRDVYTPKTI